MTDSLFSRLRHAVLVLCLFAIVVGLNWAVAERYGSDMPDWDQWDAEGLNLIAPWFEHDHFVAHLFQPHNEHRVVVTKLQNLAVLLINGQWDQRLECFFNAMVHGGIAVGLWLFGRRVLAPRWVAPLYVMIAALFALPLAWQNVLGGFHSQQYWLVGLSFLTIGVLPFSRPMSAAWWIGIAAAILDIGTMGSGFFAAPVAAAILAWRWWRNKAAGRSVWPVVSVMAILVAIGVITHVEVYYHQQLKAKSVHDFVLYVLRSLEWPLRDHDWAGALMWLPLAAVLWRFCRRDATRDSRAALTILALGGWVMLQLLATAYARGAGADYPASRYMDTLIFGTAVNAIAFGWLISNTSGRAKAYVLYGAGTAWLIAIAIGARSLLETNLLHELPDTATYYRAAEGHLRSYLATNDPTELRDPIPYPSADGLVQRLGHAAVRNAMPESVRPALPLSAASDDSSSLSHGTATFWANHALLSKLDIAPRRGLSPTTPPLDSRPTWGSFGPTGRQDRGEWRSAPLMAPMHGWLEFQTAGDIGNGRVSLELHDATTNARLASVAPSKVPLGHWRSAYVHAPRRPFVVVARDDDSTGWLAFSAPVEMGSWSYLAWVTMKNGALIAAIAVVVALLALLSEWVASHSPHCVSFERPPLVSTEA